MMHGMILDLVEKIEMAKPPQEQVDLLKASIKLKGGGGGGGGVEPRGAPAE